MEPQITLGDSGEREGVRGLAASGPDELVPRDVVFVRVREGGGRTCSLKRCVWQIVQSETLRFRVSRNGKAYVDSLTADEMQKYRRILNWCVYRKNGVGRAV